MGLTDLIEELEAKAAHYELEQESWPKPAPKPQAELRFHKAGWYRPMQEGEWTIWKWIGDLSSRYKIQDEWFSTYDDGLDFLARHTPDGKFPLPESDGSEYEEDSPELLDEEPTSVQEGCLYKIGVDYQGENVTRRVYFWVFAFFKEQAFEATKIKMQLSGIESFEIVNWYNCESHVLALV